MPLNTQRPPHTSLTSTEPKPAEKKIDAAYPRVNHPPPSSTPLQCFHLMIGGARAGPWARELKSAQNLLKSSGISIRGQTPFIQEYRINNIQPRNVCNLSVGGGVGKASDTQGRSSAEMATAGSSLHGKVAPCVSKASGMTTRGAAHPNRSISMSRALRVACRVGWNHAEYLRGRVSVPLAPVCSFKDNFVTVGLRAERARAEP